MLIVGGHVSKQVVEVVNPELCGGVDEVCWNLGPVRGKTQNAGILPWPRAKVPSNNASANQQVQLFLPTSFSRSKGSV